MAETLVQIKTSDYLTLPGILYKAPNSEKAAIYLHGNGSSSVFYSDDAHKELAFLLAKKKISLLLFNNRGAHYIKKLRIGKKGKSERFGMAYEKIKDCIYDIEGAIAMLKTHGFRVFYLIGESTGANKICVYNFYKPKNIVQKYILLGGGDDTGIYYHLLGKRKFFHLLKKAKQKMQDGKGGEIMKELLPKNEIFAYTGFYDIANPDGDYNIFPFYEILHKLNLSKKPLLREFKTLNKQTLCVYGEKDEYAWGDVQKIVSILQTYNPRLKYRVIKNADHSFSEHQKELAKLISSWL